MGAVDSGAIAPILSVQMRVARLATAGGASPRRLPTATEIPHGRFRFPPSPLRSARPRRRAVRRRPVRHALPRRPRRRGGEDREPSGDGGDVGRHVGPHFFGADDSQFFQTFNRNKKSLTLDLKHADAMMVFKRLVARRRRRPRNLRGDLPAQPGPDLRCAEETPTRASSAPICRPTAGPARGVPGRATTT